MKDLERANNAYKLEDSEEVYFHCQQALEKLVKAIYILLVGPKIPYIHEIYDIFQLVKSQLTEPADSWLPDLKARKGDLYSSRRAKNTIYT